MELKELADQMQSVWAEMKASMAENGRETGEQKAALAAMNTRLDQLEVRAQRAMVMANIQGARAEQSDERKAFSLALRKGLVGVRHESKELGALVRIASPGEAKALSLGDDTTGGFLATPDFVDDIIKAVILFSPIRAVATVRATSNRSVLLPVRKGVYAATWVSETGTRSETTGLKYGLEELPNHEMYSEVLISNQDIEDVAFDMDQQLQMEASEQFGVAEGKAFVNGSGSGQPEGIMTNAAIAAVHNGNATELLYAGLASLCYNVKSAYAAQGTWLLNRQTIGLIRQIEDTNGRPMWEPGFPGFDKMEPPAIFGRPYLEASDMPSVAAGTYPIVFGDIKRGYTIVDRVQMVVQRLVEKYAEQGQVAFLVRKRVGGQVVLADAIQKLYMAV